MLLVYLSTRRDLVDLRGAFCFVYILIFCLSFLTVMAYFFVHLKYKLVGNKVCGGMEPLYKNKTDMYV